MYATIRRYEGVARTAQEMTQASRQIAVKLSAEAGFVSFLVLEIGSGVLATVCIFEDHSGIREADQLLEELLSIHLGIRLPEHSQAFTGEIVYQKGL